jgi:hypothetical protein
MAIVASFTLLSRNCFRKKAKNYREPRSTLANPCALAGSPDCVAPSIESQLSLFSFFAVASSPTQLHLLRLCETPLPQRPQRPPPLICRTPQHRPPPVSTSQHFARFAGSRADGHRSLGAVHPPYRSPVYGTVILAPFVAVFSDHTPGHRFFVRLSSCVLTSETKTLP